MGEMKEKIEGEENVKKEVEKGQRLGIEGKELGMEGKRRERKEAKVCRGRKNVKSSRYSNERRVGMHSIRHEGCSSRHRREARSRHHATKACRRSSDHRKPYPCGASSKGLGSKLGKLLLGASRASLSNEKLVSFCCLKCPQLPHAAQSIIAQPSVGRSSNGYKAVAIPRIRPKVSLLMFLILCLL